MSVINALFHVERVEEFREFERAKSGGTVLSVSLLSVSCERSFRMKDVQSSILRFSFLGASAAALNAVLVKDAGVGGTDAAQL